MTSRFMLQAQQRNKRYRTMLGNESLTDAERKLYRRKFNESLEAYIARLQQAAAEEQVQAADWWRRLARIIQVIPGPFDDTERRLITRSCKLGWTVAQAEQAILRHRRIMKM